jgi:hypothetical protein
MIRNLFRLYFSILFWACSALLVVAQTHYQTDVTSVQTDVLRGHLDLGGKGRSGDTIGVNSFYIERNGQPVIPVIGEFHYARYPRQYWEEQLKKMKAGGISVVATYVFWNLHEFKEGVFDWSGNLDVRHFVTLCQKNGLDVIMRVGPFAHGEMRNGGLPDWLYGRPIEVRTNDQVYLHYVNRLYQEIGKQLQGLMFRDGGPIIGVQIENEYQHSAAPWAFTYVGAPKESTVGRRDLKITQDGVGINTLGNEFADVGRDHMKTLKQLAIQAGLIAPIYTATGWGMATIVEKGSIPVMAAYAFPFWSAGTDPSPFYLFKDIRKNPDYAPVSYDVNLYPSLAAELGTGMTNTYDRRPRVPGESFLPMMVRTIGSGSNGLGYYMYHGGTTPSVGNFFLSEGSGLSNKSYDYQAPIGEFGQVSPGFFGLRIMNYFLSSYGRDLAPLYPVIPSTNKDIKADNTSTLRYSVRSDGQKGFLFMHNYQDHVATQDLEGLSVSISTRSGVVTFPETGTFTLRSGASAIFPFNLNMDGVDVHLATVQPLCRFMNKGKAYHVLVAIDGIAPQMVLKGRVAVRGTGIQTSVRNGRTVVSFAEGQLCEMQAKGVSFLVLPFAQALSASLTGAEDRHLVISKALVLDEGDTFSLLSRGEELVDIAVYPAVKDITFDGGGISRTEVSRLHMSQFQLKIPGVQPQLSLVQADDRHFVLKAPQMNWSQVHDVFITFDYRGDRGICMMGGELQTDHLYSSQPWVIGLKRYGEALKEHEMYFYFLPMLRDAPYLSYLDKEVIPVFGNKREYLEISKPVITVEYKLQVRFRE